MADLARARTEAQRDFDERRAADAGAAMLEELEKKAEALASLDRRLAKLRAEQDLAAVAGENATKVRLKREELFAKEEACKSLLESRAGRFADVFGGELRAAAGAGQGAAARRRRRARGGGGGGARRDASAAAVAADGAAAATRAARGALARANAEAAEAERRAEEDADALAGGAGQTPPSGASAAGGDGSAPAARGPFAGYDARVSDIEARLKTKEADLTVLGNLSQVYTSFAASANEHRACPVCQQSLADVAAFTETVRNGGVRPRARGDGAFGDGGASRGRARGCRGSRRSPPGTPHS